MSKYPSLLILLLAVVTVHAQQPPAAQTQATTSSGSISGRVVNESGAPMPGAGVSVRVVGSNAGRLTSSDNDGNFQVNNLDAALYSISAVVPAYTIVRDPDAPPSYYRIGDNVRLEMFRGGVITGTVTNSAGDPVVGVRVRVFMVRDGKGQAMKSLMPGFGENQTDDRGIYRIYGLTPGSYVVFAGGGLNIFGFGPYDNDSPTYAPSSTRDNAVEIAVRSGDESNVDIRYRGEQGHSVSGTVRGVSVGANISLTRVGESMMPVNATFQAPDSKGFAFYGVGDGEYDISAIQSASSNPNPGLFPEIAVSETRRIIVKGNDVSGLELTPRPLGSISGRIEMEPSKLPGCLGKRRPLLSETVVEVRRNLKNPNDQESAYMRFFSSPTLPDKDGSFVARNVRDGEYSINPRFFARYWYLQSMSFGAKPPSSLRTDAARNWITLKFGDRLTGLTITLAEGAASIKGGLKVAESGKRPEKLSVYLVPAERDKLDDPLRFFGTELDADWTFTLNNLAPGRYWIVTQPPVDPELAPEKLRLPSAVESRLKLRRAAEASKTEIELKPCQNVTDLQLRQP
jgi:hypothetical protein